MGLKIRSKLLGGFTIILLLFMVVSLYALHNVHALYDNIKMTMEHPLVVSNTAKKIEVQITSMHRNVKDITISSNKKERNKYISLMNKNEQDVFSSFNVIEKQILGEKGKKLVQDVEKMFLNWEPIRKKIIDLVNVGNFVEAQKITQTIEKDYVNKLIDKVSLISDYAFNKAIGFNRSSYKIVRHTRLSIIISLVVGVIVSFVLAFYLSISIVKRLNKVGAVAISMANGNFKERIKANGDDEIDAMAKSINIMAQKISKSHQGLESEVQTKTNELEADLEERKKFEKLLQKRLNELEVFQKASVGRELKMVELKKEINELLKELGREPKY